MNPQDKILSRAALQKACDDKRARGGRIVFTNGCFDILHAGHVELLHQARAHGDFLVVGLNSDASVRRLKGASRPVNEQAARALVLAALQDVDAVCAFDEDTPQALIEAVRPNVHVKGGDYQADDLPEAATVRKEGGEVVIVPLRQGFSTTGTIEKLQAQDNAGRGEACLAPTTPTSATPTAAAATRAVIVIPARWASTRFPGKPLALLGGRPVIEHVARAALQSQSEKPIVVATDDERIADAVQQAFSLAEVAVAMTSAEHRTGTERLAEAVRARFDTEAQRDLIVVNVQGDEPFIDPAHIDALLEVMRADSSLPMATLAAPIREASQLADSNVVKVVLARNGDALYFSRLPLPFERDAAATNDNHAPHLRHLGIYAYRAAWLLEMAAMPPSPLEEREKLEQLRALENGRRIGVALVESAVPIAIDTPADLQQAQRYLDSSA